MRKDNKLYEKFILEKIKIPPSSIERGNFYTIKSYKNIDNIKTNYKEIDAPIIFVLYTSKKNDEVHAIKLSDTKINDIKKLFSGFLNKDSKKIELKGQSKKIYESVLKKTPTITNETYRTYKWSGIESVFKLNTDLEKIKIKNNK